VLLPFDDRRGVWQKLQSRNRSPRLWTRTAARSSPFSVRTSPRTRKSGSP